MLSFRQKNVAIAAFVVAILLTFAAILSFYLPSSRASVKDKSSNSKPSFSHSFQNWANLTDEERIKELERGARKIESDSELSRIFPQIRLPKQTFGKKVLGRFLYGDPDEEGSFVTVLYEGGMYFSATKKNIKPDYKTEIEELRAAYKRGELKSDSIPEPITIKGREGFFGKAGYNIVHGVKEPRPAVIVFYDSGIQYELYGPPDNSLSLDDLIKVCESMF